MDDQPRQALVQLYGLVERGVDLGAALRLDPGPFRLSGYGEESILIRGEAFALFERIQAQLASSALADGGPSRTFVSALVVDSCREASTDPEAGVRWLDEKLSEGNSSWRVVEHINGIFPAAPRRVGRTTLHSALPPHLVIGDTRFITIPIDRPMLIADVVARDRESAERRAKDLFDEARSILALASTSSTPRAALVTIDASGRAVSSTGNPECFIPSGSRWGSLRALEEAAAKEPYARSDWERRSLAACRWLRKAELTEWPSEALAACMTVLECLFVEGKSAREKGKAIAHRIARDRDWQLPGLEGETAMHAWLIRMYQRRSDAVHDGAHCPEDFEVDRLVSLANYSVRWAAWHLDPDHDHHVPERPCVAFAEAMSGPIS